MHTLEAAAMTQELQFLPHIWETWIEFSVPTFHTGPALVIEGTGEGGVNQDVEALFTSLITNTNLILHKSFANFGFLKIKTKTKTKHGGRHPSKLQVV